MSKRAVQSAIAFSLALALSAASGDGCKKAQWVPLTIIHTNDLHSHMTPAKIAPFGLGGLARMAKKIQKIRTTHKTNLTLDAGDWSEGSWMYNVDMGHNMLEAMKMMGFDAAVVGNHDYINGPTTLLEVARGGGVPLVAANWDAGTFAQGAELRERIPAFRKFERGGVSIGVIGLTLYEQTYKKYLEPMIVMNPLDEATKQAALHRKEVDILILLSHNSFSTNVAIAKAVPGVDVIVSGHSHHKTYQPTYAENAGRQVPIVETGEWGQFVGQLDLEIEAVTKQVRVAGYQLHPVDASDGEDEQMAAWVQGQELKLKTAVGEDPQSFVARARADFAHEDSIESTQGNLIVDAMRAQTGTEFALDQVSLTGAGLKAGDLNAKDMHDLIPHILHPQTRKEWTLYKWNALGRDLLTVMLAFKKVEGLMPMSSLLGWLTLSGGVVTWDPKLFSIIDFRDIFGEPIDPGRRYSVTLTAGLLDALKQAKDLIKIPGVIEIPIDFTQLEDTGIEAWRAVRTYIQVQREIDPKDYEIGKRSLLARADWAIKSSSLRWDPAQKVIRMSVGNAAVSGDAPATKLKCYVDFSGEPARHRSQQSWKDFGSLDLPLMPPGAWQEVVIPVTVPFAGDGKTPVRCTVDWADDPYQGNQAATAIL